MTALDASAGGAGGPDPGREGGVGTELDQRVRRRGVVGEPTATEDHAGTRGLHGPPFHLRAPRREQRVPRRAGADRGFADAECVAGGLDDGLPPGAPAQMGPQGRLHRGARRAAPRARRPERGQPHDDPRCAKAALARPVGDEGGRPAVTQLGRRPFEGGHTTAGHAADRRDAGDTWRVVHPHGAASALPLGAAAVLDGAAPELLAQRIEEGDPVADGHLVAVEQEGDVRGHGGILGRGAVLGRGAAAGRFRSGARVAQQAGCPVGPGLS